MPDTLPPQGQWQPTQPQYQPPYTGTGQYPPDTYYPQPVQPTLPAQPFYVGPEVYQQPPPPPPIPSPPPPPSRTRTIVIASVIILVAVVGNVLVFGNRIGISLPTAAPQHYKVGQAVQISNYVVAVRSVQVALPSSMYNNLNYLSDRYFIAQVSVKNTGSQAQIIDQTNFILRDLTGQQYELVYDPDAPMSITGEANPGETITGSVVYEIPQGVSLFTLSFQPDLTAPDQAIWDVSV